MFDRIDRSDRSTTIRFPDTIKIQEHKAPTDESIRLAEDLKEKQLQNIIRTIKVDTNLIKACVIAVAEELSMNGVRVFIKFDVNGTEFNIEERVDRFDIEQEFHKWMSLDSKMTVFQILARRVSDIICINLLEKTKDPINWKVLQYQLNSK